MLLFSARRTGRLPPWHGNVAFSHVTCIPTGWLFVELASRVSRVQRGKSSRPHLLIPHRKKVEAESVQFGYLEAASADFPALEASSSNLRMVYSPAYPCTHMPGIPAVHAYQCTGILGKLCIYLRLPP